MKGRILLGLSMAVNLGLIGWWAALPSNSRVPPTADPVVPRIPRTVSLIPPEALPATAVAPARPREFRWSQIESADYPTYIANLRAIGAPEKTIRDIVLAAVERAFQSRLEATRQADSGQFWRTGEQREKLRRESNRPGREFRKEKQALIKTLLGLDYDQSALEVWWEERESTLVLSFLPEPKPVEIIAIVSRFGEEVNEIDDRAGGILTPDEVTLKKSLFNGMLAELDQRLTPSQLEEAELRGLAAMSGAFSDVEPSGLKLTGAELRELIRLKWHWDSPFKEEFEWPGEAFEEERRRGREEFAARARKLMGDDRFAGFLVQDDSDFEPIHALAQRQHLSSSTALVAYEIMRATTAELARARRDRTLRAGERRAQMHEVRHSAAQALRQALGERAFSDYLAQDAAQWVVSPVKR